MRILGAVLAGGRSRRFGSDKAQALLAGRSLLAHVVDALRSQADAVILCGRGGSCNLDVHGIPDRPRAGLGPLGGLNAALHHVAAHGFDAVLTAGCDTPRLPENLRARLAAYSPPAVLGALPIVGLWPVALAGRLDSYLEGADRSMYGWARDAGATMVEVGPMPNINTPEDLVAFIRGAGEHSF